MVVEGKAKLQMANCREENLEAIETKLREVED